jgi:hypothetical protein
LKIFKSLGVIFGAIFDTVFSFIFENVPDTVKSKQLAFLGDQWTKQKKEKTKKMCLEVGRNSYIGLPEHIKQTYILN